MFKFEWDMPPKATAILNNIYVTAITFEIVADGSLVQTLAFPAPVSSKDAIQQAETWLNIQISPEEYDDLKCIGATQLPFEIIYIRGDILQNRRAIYDFKYLPHTSELIIYCYTIMM